MKERLAGWTLVAVTLIGEVGAHGLEFSEDLIGRLFAPRLTFLGLVITIGVFQYGVFARVVQEAWQHINNPQWREFARRFRAMERAAPGGVITQEVGENLAAMRAQLERWRRYQADEKRRMRENVIPHSEAVLVNILAVGGSLLLSAVGDVLGFLLQAQADIPTSAFKALRVWSTGLFAFSFLPLFHVGWRYILALHWEFRAHRGAFDAEE